MKGFAGHEAAASGHYSTPSEQRHPLIMRSSIVSPMLLIKHTDKAFNLYPRRIFGLTFFSGETFQSIASKVQERTATSCLDYEQTSADYETVQVVASCLILPFLLA